jgi:hypothetical protein
VFWGGGKKEKEKSKRTLRGKSDNCFAGGGKGVAIDALV